MRTSLGITVTRYGALDSLQQVFRYNWVGYWLNTERHIVTKVSNNCRCKGDNLFLKTALGFFFKIVLCLRDRNLFIWGLVKFKWLFLPSTLKIIFYKTTILFEKLEYSIFVNYTLKDKVIYRIFSNRSRPQIQAAGKMKNS